MAAGGVLVGMMDTEGSSLMPVMPLRDWLLQLRQVVVISHARAFTNQAATDT